MTTHDITRHLDRRILILDGAMGTMIQRYRLGEADYRGNRFTKTRCRQQGNNELLTLTRPDIIADIHRSYLEAGADIITTNTFGATSVGMAEYGEHFPIGEINREAAALARRLADEYTLRYPEKPRWVAGSIGPTGKSCAMSAQVDNPAAREVTFDTMAAAYAEQIEALIAGGVDLLLIETVFDTLTARAAIEAARTVMQRTGQKLPVMLSVTIADKAGRMLAGQTVEAFLASVAYADILSVGLNCSFGAADMRPVLERIAAIAPCYVSAYPNAGLPDATGSYDQTPEMMAREVGRFVNEGLVNIIGGCCGTTDAHIAQYAALVRRSDGSYHLPRRPRPRAETMILAGLEAMQVTGEPGRFVNVGERCNVAGSRKFLRLIKEKKYDEAIAIARDQIEAGAEIIDINMDDALLDTPSEMVHLLRLLAGEPDVSRVPFMIDTSSDEVVTEALKCIQGKCIVNSISLRDGEDAFLQRAATIRRYGAAVVVMAFDERGQADTYERKIEVCERAYRLLTERAVMPAHDIIFDPNILAICTGMPEHDGYAADFIRATAWIRTHLQGAHVSGGVSNLSFAFRGNNYIREAMHAVFLHHAIAAGMDMGIVNPMTCLHYEDLPRPLRDTIEAAVLGREGGAEALIEAAHRVGVETPTPQNVTHARPWREESVEERLKYALIHGTPDFIEADLREALPRYTRAVEIIEGPLMEAMTIVGERFGRGEMFLPQVVKTARTMKRAVSVLQPVIEAEKQHGDTAGCALIATVKGDVHDIGKNIVSVVLSCNGYEVADLGVMCPPEDIVRAARELHPAFIGLSGLITPSLAEMVETARALNEAGIRVPLMIGGATTSAMYTALRIAPVYAGPAIWVRDASQIIPVAARATHADVTVREAFIEELHREQQRLREEYADRERQKAPTVSIDEAREKRLKLF